MHLTEDQLAWLSREAEKREASGPTEIVPCYHCNRPTRQIARYNIEPGDPVRCDDSACPSRRPPQVST